MSSSFILYVVVISIPLVSLRIRLTVTRLTWSTYIFKRACYIKISQNQKNSTFGRVAEWLRVFPSAKKIFNN